MQVSAFKLQIGVQSWGFKPWLQSDLDILSGIESVMVLKPSSVKTEYFSPTDRTRMTIRSALHDACNSISPTSLANDRQL
jgi:hypothetical protein